MSHSSSLNIKTYKYKNFTGKVFCALCRTERVLFYRSHLNLKNYFQILLIVTLLIASTYSFMGMRTFLIWPPLVWVFFEGGVKFFYRQELPCPHCGFDAVWYRKDVKKTREIVERFWKEKQAINSNSTLSSEVKSPKV